MRTSVILGNYLFGILAFHILRMYELIEGLQEDIGEKASFWHRHRDTLYDSKVVDASKLTDWQLWSLPLPGAESVLILML